MRSEEGSNRASARMLDHSPFGTERDRMDKDKNTSSGGGYAAADLPDFGGTDRHHEPTWWTPMSRIVPTTGNTDVMNQLCRVCGEPAAGFHFGAFTCEGCKSFFGRTYNNLGSISECKNGGVCVINKKNRTTCKACRLRKCLMVGMSKSGSRYGRRSNWFKIHCLLQEQSHRAQARLMNDPKTAYEKAFASLDVANNNDIKSGIKGSSNSNVTRSRSSSSSSGNSNSNSNNNNNNNNNNDNNDNNDGNSITGVDRYHRPSSLHHSHGQRSQGTTKLRSKREESSVEGRQVVVVEAAPTVNRGPILRPSSDDHVGRTARDMIIRPEISRFPTWRGPPFFHPALVTHMHLLSAPFFTFQQRFLVPYQSGPPFGGPQVLTGHPVVVSSSSESSSPRSTPSPKEAENAISRDGRKNGTNTTVVVVRGFGSERMDVAHVEKSLAYLRSLGPEQVEPIDLSIKSRDNVTSRMIGQDAVVCDILEEARCMDNDNNAYLRDIGPLPPLDLTRKT